MTNKKERVVVYIDGNNLRHRLMESQVRLKRNKIFDYNKFVDYLIDDRTCISKRYYVGIVRNIDNSKKSKELVGNQQKFLELLKKNKFVIKPGRIVYDSGKIREKGVDVKIAVDLVVGAFENHYDTAILVSSDTDLIPALKYVRHKKKKIEYVGFSHRPSLGLISVAHASRLISTQDIEKFIN